MGIGESLPLRPLGVGATPPEPEVRHPTRKNCNRKTHKNGIYTTPFRLFGVSTLPPTQKNTDTLPPPARSLPPRGLTVPMYAGLVVVLGVALQMLLIWNVKIELGARNSQQY